MQCYLYILTNKYHNTFYTGVTSDLIGRVWQHKTNYFDKSFSKKYNLKYLVYFDMYEDIETAILFEKKLKKWPRRWKIRLIEKKNPTWDDLYIGSLT